MILSLSKNLLLFGRHLYTVNMPDIAAEQEQNFLNAIQSDDFNTILEMKMKGYRPSVSLLETLQNKISSNSFIAVVKIFGMDELLKNVQNVDLGQRQPIKENKRNMNMEF